MGKMSRQEAEEIVRSARFIFLDRSADDEDMDAQAEEVLVMCHMEFGHNRRLQPVIATA